MLESKVPRQVRAIFVSDLHLGCPFSTGHRIVQVFDAIQSEKIFLVGDCFDESRLRLRWTWTENDSAVVRQLSELIRSGVEIFVTPGNHDMFFRSADPAGQLGSHKRLPDAFRTLLDLEIGEQFEYHTLSGRRLLVTHGDLFDTVDKSLAGIPKLGSGVFDRINWLIPRSWVLGLRRFFKKLFAKPKMIQAKLRDYALANSFEGIVFGHLHSPALQRRGDFIIANCGDWMGNESFLVETLDGKIQMINFGRICEEIE